MSLRNVVEKHDLWLKRSTTMDDDNFFNGQCVCVECESDGFYRKRKREGERERASERGGERDKREREREG